MPLFFAAPDRPGGPCYDTRPFIGSPGSLRRMQLFLDLLPVVAFFIAYKVAGIYVATAVLIAGVMALTALSWIRHRKVSPMLLTSAVLVLVFGGLTLFLHDSTFIKWKPTIVDWLFAAAFLVSQFWRGAPLVQRLMGEQVQLETPVWKRLNLMWVVFFAVCGALNLYVAFNYSEEVWVDFKLFGLFGLTFVFAILQGVWIARHSEAQEAGKT